MTDLMGLYQTAAKEGVDVVCFELEARESISIQEGEECFIAIDPFQLSSSRDEKVKLAHEMGHCITGSFYNFYSGLDVRQRHENRADKWSIAQLVPEEDLNQAIAEGCTSLWELSERFDVSEDLMKKAICWYKNGNLDVDSYFG